MTSPKIGLPGEIRTGQDSLVELIELFEHGGAEYGRRARTHTIRFLYGLLHDYQFTTEIKKLYLKVPYYSLFRNYFQVYQKNLENIEKCTKKQRDRKRKRQQCLDNVPKV